MVAIVIFSAAVFESFLYLISNGALDWGPADAASAARELIEPTHRDRVDDGPPRRHSRGASRPARTGSRPEEAA